MSQLGKELGETKGEMNCKHGRHRLSLLLFGLCVSNENLESCVFRYIFYSLVASWMKSFRADRKERDVTVT